MWALSLYWGVIYNAFSAERWESLCSFGFAGGFAELGYGTYTIICGSPDTPPQEGWHVRRVTVGRPFAGPKLLRAPGVLHLTVPIWLLLLLVWLPWVALWGVAAIRHARRVRAHNTSA
jgi:hypothetical protein